jgi:hypothetical protein
MASWRCAAWASWVRLEQQSIILSLAGRTTYSSGSSGLELHDTGVNMPGVKEKYTMTKFFGWSPTGGCVFQPNLRTGEEPGFRNR